jgi:ABC-type transporter Mla maintaining outer membrane lipid asymmetry ATPase subunit MlaF
MTAIELANVSVELEEQGSQAELTLAVEPGEFLALVGPNRSGKGLILKLCAGLVEPEAGTVRILGLDLADLDEEAQNDLRRRVGVVLQQPGLLSNMTVYNNVALPLRYHRGLKEPELEPLVMEKLDWLGLAASRNRFPSELNQGEARRAAIARALVMESELLLLDSPTDGLDAVELWALARLLTEAKRTRLLTVLATLHMFSPLLQAADRIALVRHGRVELIGRHGEVLAQADSEMRAYLEACQPPGQESLAEMRGVQ